MKNEKKNEDLVCIILTSKNKMCGFEYKGYENDFFHLIYSLKIYDQNFFDLLSKIFSELNYDNE